ncbi:hypothetical protein DDZ13_05850 [Coraliomargarita sinensis]|uniref:HTH gntR-type domain-containing protein n=1 Tax=Coraliomargarita sinensis TaxID=2174842 RepID=A0A317ZGC1_9BACT|nr:substrate-binding domain-containing protein [Coraliomargarita sinensis]PXA04694.1 hypothetical protein DDZ13_05850 [Coraliomargarita sinensis]
MEAFQAKSTVEQLATHLRDEIKSGTLRETLPGVHRLAAELGVSTKTVVAAVRQLEKEGLVINQGERRSVRIVGRVKQQRSGTAVRVLTYDKVDQDLPYMIELMHRMKAAGHQPDYATKSMQEIAMDPRKLARLVRNNPGDAWIICGGSLEILQWFVGQPFPVFAMFGRMSGLDLAGVVPRKIPAMQTAVDQLVRMGHRRIVLLVREDHRSPTPALFEQAFLDRLMAHGIQVGSYNLPDWEETREGLHEVLDTLFKVTPPTALFISEVQLFLGAYQYLAGRQISVPKDLSLICTDPAPEFDWCQPPISHIDWNAGPMIQAVLKWTNGVARGQNNKKQTRYKTKFIEGGTIGPATG